MRKYDTTTSVSQPVDRPARLSPVEHAGQTAVGVFGGGALVTLALLAGGVIGFAALPLAGAVILGLSATGFLVLAGGSLAHLGLYVAETLSRRDIDGDGTVGAPGGKEIQVVPYRHWQAEPSYRPAGSETGISKSDLRWLIGHLDLDAQSGWTERGLLDEQMPSGAVVNRDVYDAFIRLLTQHNWLVGRTERFKGRLMLGPDEIAQELGL